MDIFGRVFEFAKLFDESAGDNELIWTNRMKVFPYSSVGWIVTVKFDVEGGSDDFFFSSEEGSRGNQGNGTGPLQLSLHRQ